MENGLLLPNQYKRFGFLLLLPSLALGIMVRFFDFEFAFLTLQMVKTRINNKSMHLEDTINLTDEFALSGIIIALLFIAFAREKIEDEYIARTRLDSLKWAVLINYILLLVATWLVHGFAYIDVMMYNMLTVLIIFIVRFNYTLNSTKTTD